MLLVSAAVTTMFSLLVIIGGRSAPSCAAPRPPTDTAQHWQLAVHGSWPGDAGDGREED
jgi:hypothetical protein